MHEVSILPLVPLSWIVELIPLPCRCPIECRLMRGVGLEWSCRVFLRRVSASGQPKEPFGAVITDRVLLEHHVLRAQLAVLNPSIPPQRFVDEDIDFSGKSELSFSPDIVCLEITGPEYTDISFVDLPGTPPKSKLQHTSLLIVPTGLIRNVGTSGDPENIQLIENLATSYIEKDNCIILMTITCESAFSCLTSIQGLLTQDISGFCKPRRIRNRASL